MYSRLIVLGLVVAAHALASVARADDAQLAAARQCLDDALDDLVSAENALFVPCPSLASLRGFDTHDIGDLSLELLPVGFGGTLQLSTDLPISCGGGMVSSAWLAPTAMGAPPRGFVAQGHDVVRGVVYGLASDHQHFGGMADGRFDAVRYVVATGALQSLGMRCLAVTVVASADAWVCEHGDGRVAVGALDLARPLPTSADADPMGLSMLDVRRRAFELGRGVALVRDAYVPRTFARPYRTLVLPTPDRVAPATVALDVTGRGAVVDLGAFVDGPLYVTRLAMLHALRRQGELAHTPARDAVMRFGADGVVPTLAPFDASASIAAVAAHLGLAPLTDGDLFLAAAWSDAAGLMPNPLEETVTTIRTVLGLRVRAVALRFVRADATFVIEVVIDGGDGRTRARFESMLGLTEGRLSRSTVAGTTRFSLTVDPDGIGTALVRLPRVPMSAAFEARLRRVEGPAPVFTELTPREVSACDTPTDAVRRRAYDALATRNDECASFFEVDDDLLDTFVERATRDCMRGNDTACSVLAREADLVEVDRSLTTMLLGVCERRGGSSCHAIDRAADSDGDRALAAVDRRCAAGRAGDCAFLWGRARWAYDEDVTAVVRARDRACRAGEGVACAEIAFETLATCRGREACLGVAEQMLRACELDSDEACRSLRHDPRLHRISGVPAAAR